ncbi:MAG: glycosyltransferase family 4 protein [Actinomycetota bacterium]|nr:glycosyltransferase family 4 protein [Actinomycetota bacterium]
MSGDRLRVAMTLEQCWHRVPGGTAVAALGQARLLERGQVDVVGVAAAHRSPPSAEWLPPVPVRHLLLPRIALYESWHRLRRPSVSRATGAVDIVHATTFAIPPRSAPLIVTVHDLAFVHDPSNFTKHGVAFFRRGLELTREDADLIVCPSQATLDDCVSHGIDVDRLRVVPLGVDQTAADASTVSAVRLKYGLSRPYVLWVGTAEPRKNLRRLLEAFSTIDDAEIDLIVVGPKGWNETLGPLVARSGGRVRTLGFVPRSDLGPLYAGARAFCFPSLLEGFGFPVLEAMTHGTPVVTSRGTSTEEIAGDAAVLVDPLDTSDIARGLASILDDQEFASRLADAGRKRAATFTWERSADRLADVYREVA